VDYLLERRRQQKTPVPGRDIAVNMDVQVDE